MSDFFHPEAYERRRNEVGGRPAGKSQGAASAGEPPEVRDALTADHPTCIHGVHIRSHCDDCGLPHNGDGGALRQKLADRVDAEDTDNTTDRT